MIGPYHATGPSGIATAIDLAIQISNMGTRTYVFLAVEGHDPDYPTLEGIQWAYFGNAYGEGERLMEGDAHKSVTLLGMAMDGEWNNQEAVNGRRKGIADFCGDLAKELNQNG